jgi:phenylalanyl-tRNA synthetase beta chain
LLRFAYRDKKVVGVFVRFRRRFMRKTIKDINSSRCIFRFERGIDPSITAYALKRAALLIQEEVAGGEITSEIVDIYNKN